MDKTILGHSLVLFSSQVFIKVVAFFYNIFLAQNLGVSNFGLYTTATAYFYLASTFIDFGISRFVTRELALGKIKPSSLLTFSIISKALLFIVYLTIIITFVSKAELSLERAQLTMLAITAALPQIISTSLDTFFLATLKVLYSALGSLVVNLSSIVAGLILLTSGFEVQGAVTALLVGQVLYVFFMITLFKKSKLSVFSLIDIKFIINGFKNSLPYGLLGIISLLYFRVDTLFLTYMKGSYETGIYGVSYKFLETAVIIPSVFSVTIFPKLVKLHVINSDEIKENIFKLIGIMVVFSLMVLVTYILLLPLAIQIFLPKYLSAINIVRILALAIPFIYIYVPLSQILLSNEKYLKAIILIALLPLLLNLLLNYLFIPKYGIWAAAWITVISDFTSLLALLGFIIPLYFKNKDIKLCV